MSEWIPAAKRLPKVNENVIVNVSGERLEIDDFVSVDRFDGEEWLGFGEDVIAWMPATEDNKRDAIYQEWFTEDGQIHAQKMGLLIRCKDCKYNNGGRCSWHGGAGYKWIVDDEDYCSCAARRDE